MTFYVTSPNLGVLSVIIIFIGKKTSRKHFEKNNMCRCVCMYTCAYICMFDKKQLSPTAQDICTVTHTAALTSYRTRRHLTLHNCLSIHINSDSNAYTSGNHSLTKLSCLWHHNTVECLIFARTLLWDFRQTPNIC